VKRGRRSDVLKRFGPGTYPVIALLGAALLLPSALRPPPEQTNDSAALNPGAPPDQQAEQIVQSVQQARGGGAGAVQSTKGTAGATATAPSPPPPPPTGPPASGRCYGNPKRQTQSVYSAPCAPSWSGNNGGVTGHNVFPNEVRLGLWHVVGSPTPGRVGTTPPGGESPYDRTFRVLQDYFNKRYQTYGRHIAFYGLRPADSIQDQQAEAVRADTQDKLFGAYYLWQGFCEEFVRRGGVVMCNPLRHEVYNQHRPGLFSFYMDRTQANGYGAEWMCKRIVGKPPKFAGAQVDKTKPRKIAIITENHSKGGVPPSLFEGIFKRECGGVLVDKIELTAEQAPDAASQAVAKLKSEGVTTIINETVIYNSIYLTNAAESLGWQPEWIQFAANGLDASSNIRDFPANQRAHQFGLGAFEVPLPFPQTECYQAYRSIDPANEPDATSCLLFWHPMVMLMNGIQEAGPHLNQKSFDAALMKIPRRFPAEPWAIGGGFGQDDYSYMDNISEIWFDVTAKDTNGSTGAYRWTNKARRYQRGQFTRDDSQLFSKGVVTPGGAETS
jgi:hypothetical protein